MAPPLGRLGRTAVWAVALVVPLPLLSIAVSRLVEVVRDNRPHAAKVFDGIVPYDATPASRGWHPPSAGLDRDCTYAAVDRADDALEEPPPRGRREAERRLAFGGEWQPTPAAPLGESARDALPFCARFWDREPGKRLAVATSSAGPWYVRDPVGETVFVHSLPPRIAARVRIGD